MRYADCPGTSVQLLIDAPAERVWDLVSDPARPVSTSDELQEAAWGRHPSGEPGVGSTIMGTNRNDALGQWTTTSYVTEWEPGRCLSWAVVDVEASAARWSFELEAQGQKTVLRQHYNVGPGPSGLSMVIDQMPDKESAIISSRLRAQGLNMMRTLVSVKAEAEGSGALPVRVLLVPGGGGSDPGHWHHAWAAADDRCRWVDQTDPSGGTREDWVATLDRVIGESAAPTVLVAHSLATVVVAHWVASCDAVGGAGPVVGALLVGPADVEDSWAEPGSLYERFAPIPVGRLPFPSVVVASTDDPYISVDRARSLGWAWGSQIKVLGAHGHLGADADLGEWPEGRALLDGLLSELGVA